MHQRADTSISRAEALARWATYQQRLKRARQARHFWHQDERQRQQRRERQQRVRQERARDFFGLYYLL